ncbi:MAG: 1-deoxy-D-xylulose-5-phosphate synthase [Erysipelotrichaceae bacterium]
MDVTKIKDPSELKKLNLVEMNQLAHDIRTFLIHSVSKTGGHLSSNLGIVELTMAMHYVFESPKDKFIFDVGHQSYIHKILTGRADQFETLRQFNGLSGFQKRSESAHDPWEAGHSSTSLSAALGFAVARDLSKEDYQVVPVIGDGSLMNGMSLEALNQIGHVQANMVIIFNDNNMSISQNVGALTSAFTKLRTSKGYNVLKSDLADTLKRVVAGDKVLDVMREFKNTVKENLVPTSIFSEFEIDYIGPVDGHDLKALIQTLQIAKRHQGPIVVHVLTKKGKGYRFAENDEVGAWHGVSQFQVENGKSLAQTPCGVKAWSSVLADDLCTLAMHNQDIVAISPAMVSGSKLDKFFTLFPTRSFDCGIAEEHAMTFAAGLAASGKRPFISIYSSFLQRAYDQINHDICRMDLPVVIGIDRAGLVGEDGDTHHGVFDISILSSLPNLILSQPKDADEAMALLKTAFGQSHPFAIRYPRGSVKECEHQVEPIEVGSWTSFGPMEFNKVVIAYGPDVDRLVEKVEANQLPVRIVNARFFKPLDTTMLDELAAMNLELFVYETDMLKGGLGSAIIEYYNDQKVNITIQRIGIGDHFVQHGSMPQLRKVEKIDIHHVLKELSQDEN